MKDYPLERKGGGGGGGGERGREREREKGKRKEIPPPPPRKTGNRTADLQLGKPKLYHFIIDFRAFFGMKIFLLPPGATFSNFLPVKVTWPPLQNIPTNS